MWSVEGRDVLHKSTWKCYHLCCSVARV